MAPRKTVKSKKADPLGSLKSNSNLLSTIAVVLVAFGMVLLHRGHAFLGFGLLVVVFLLLGAVLFDWVPNLPVSVVRGPKRPKKAPSKPASRSRSGRGLTLPLKLTRWSKTQWGGVVLILLGIFLGIKAQGLVILSPEMPGWKIWVFFALAAALFTAGLVLLGFWKQAPEADSISPAVEWTALGLILALAAFLRIYRLDSMPSGMFIDQGMEGWSALRILHEHFRPIWEFDVWQNPGLLLYQLAAWFLCWTPFHFVPSQFSFYLFYALFSLATLPLVYWTFRQIGGQRLALLGTFILAVMRWNINFSRNGFPTIEVPFYTFGTLAFLTYAMRPTKSRFFYPAAITVVVFFFLGCAPFLSLAFGSVLGGMRLWAMALTVVLLLAALAGAVYLGKTVKDKEAYLSAALAGVFFAVGLYTYQAYKIVPLLLLLFALYEAALNWKGVRDHWKSLAGFSLVFLFLAYPFMKHTYDIRQQLGGSREGELLIFSKVKEAHSWEPLVYNLERTAVMFNWHGDPMARHNLQDYRMLDDVTGVLFLFGIVGAFAFSRKKPYFYGLAGLLVMSVPCVISIDAAHANRMLGTTPFIALLAALPLAALWSRLRAFWGQKADDFFPLLLILPLGLMTLQNYDAYFNKMAKSISSWSEYSARETAIGRAIAKYGDSCEYYISPIYYNYYTLNYFGYFHQERMHPLLLPDTMISHSPDVSRGLYYAIEEGRTGILEMLKALYPGGTDEYLLDPSGNTAEYFFRVPAPELAKVRGLTAHFDREVAGAREEQVNQFPAGLPKGPYHAVLTGNLYLSQMGRYQWDLKGNVKAVLRLKGRAPGGKGLVEKGEHPVEVDLTVPDGVVPALTVQQVPQNGVPSVLDAGSFDSLASPRGLLGLYYKGDDWKGTPFLEEWDPVLNFTNGNDFSTPPVCLVLWTGKLEVEEPGNYRFLFSPAGVAKMKIDGKELDSASPDGMFLRKGSHSLDLYAGRPGYWPSFSFQWIKPNGKVEVVPYSAFGEVH